MESKELAGIINGFSMALRLLVHRLEASTGFDRNAYANLLSDAAADAKRTADPAIQPRLDILALENLARLIQAEPPDPRNPSSWTPTVIEGGLSHPKES